MSFILILRRSDMSSRMRVDVVTRTVFTKGGTKSISRDARPRLIFLGEEGKPTMNPTASAPASTAAPTSSSLVIPHSFTRTNLLGTRKSSHSLGGVSRPHQRRPDEESLRPSFDKRNRFLPGLDSTLAHDGLRAWVALQESVGGFERDL